MIKDYWIYQQASASPWSLYVVKEYERSDRSVSGCTIDLTVYHEDIPNDMRAHSVVGIKGQRVEDVVNSVETEIIDAIPTITFTSQDHDQLMRSFFDIFIS